MLCRSTLTTLALALLLLPTPRVVEANLQGDTGRPSHFAVAFTQTIGVDGSAIEIDFALGTLDASREKVVQRIQTAAYAVAGYYGRFPVPRARILVLPVAGRHGVLQGTTWETGTAFQRSSVCGSDSAPARKSLQPTG